MTPNALLDVGTLSCCVERHWAFSTWCQSWQSSQSTRRLHQAVLECLATNDSTYKFKPSVALKRHQSLNELDVQDDDVAIADDTEQVPAKADPAENAVAVAVN